MLMLVIISWGQDLLIQPVHSIQEARDLKRRIGRDNMDFVIYDSVFLMPLRFDIASRQLADSEVEELKRGSAYPMLVQEGRITVRHGRPVPVRG